MFRKKPINFNTTTPKLPKINNVVINGIVVNYSKLSLGTIGVDISRTLKLKKHKTC
jgi:hypothetical protein